MILEDFNLIYDLIEDLKNEINDINHEIEYNERCLVEAKLYFYGKEDSGESEDVFSPRRYDDVKNKTTEADKEINKYIEKIQELKKQKNSLYEKIEKLKNLIKKKDYGFSIIEIQEQDRQRIARDLHDTSLQNLAHLVHKIELSSLYIDKDPIQAKLELSIVNKILKQTIDEIRNTIFDLRPMTFDDLGFKSAIERLIDNINENNKYTLNVNIEEVSCETNLVLVTIYRIIQECLNNIVKHANASKINISCINKNDYCFIDIEDDGIGFSLDDEQKEKHFGLVLVKEKTELLNGIINIQSELNNGTRIHLEIPLT